MWLELSLLLTAAYAASAADKCGYDSCVGARAGVLNVHIVPHTHDDVGWLKTVDQYYYGGRNNIQKAGVQYILDSVVKELWENPKRRFVYVETAFFWKWWMRQTKSVQKKVRTLVSTGRLQFAGGAWSMNDEATTHYQSTIDQFTWGLRKLNDTFGRCGSPRAGWQIDPFGHSREFASLLAGMGYDGLFLGRIDYQDKWTRLTDKRMEMLWRGDDDLGGESDIFTGVLYNTYSPPAGFCFDVLCDDEPIIDDVTSTDFNVDRRVSSFLNASLAWSRDYRTNNTLLTMGGDFTYQDAAMWYTNLDMLIKYTNLKAAEDGLNVNLFYSTPDCYLKAVRDADPVLPTKQDDFFPYASDEHSYWAGYFTSRPTVKRYEREANTVLQMVKQIQVLAHLEEKNNVVINELRSVMGVMQHHDAITGTEKQHVTSDYERMLTAAVEDAADVVRQALSKWMQTSDYNLERCRLNESSCYTSERSDRFVVSIYNPLAWPLEATPVRIPVVEGEYRVIAPNGEAIQTQLVPIPEPILNLPTRLSAATHELVFLACHVKALGYKNFYVEKSVGGRQRRDARETHYWRSVREHNLALKQKYGTRELYVEEGSAPVPNADADISKIYIETADNRSLELTLDILRNSKEDIMRLKSESGGEQSAYVPSHGQTAYVPSHGQTAYVPSHGQTAYVPSHGQTAYVPSHGQTAYVPSHGQTAYVPSHGQTAYVPSHGQTAYVPSHGQTAYVPSHGQSTSDDKWADMLSDQPTVVEVRPPVTEDEIRAQYHKRSAPAHNVTLYTDIQYYPAHRGNNSQSSSRASGAYILRPARDSPLPLAPRSCAPVADGGVVKETYCTFGNYTSYTIRKYAHPSLEYDEVDWLVGPIPVGDDVGKEVVISYQTSIGNNGVFYTDSNGRQMLARKLNSRPTWNLSLSEPVAGNYYPLTNQIYIQDGSRRFTVLTDRAHGASSMLEGNVEVMLHRRLLDDDAFGVGEALNEIVNKQGLVVRGTHWIMVTEAGETKSAHETKHVLEAHLRPQIFVSNADDLKLEDWLTKPNCFGTARAVPEGLHLLTLEPWRPGRLLLRLENYLQKSENISNNNNRQINLQDMFVNITLKSMRETTLAANRWMDETEQWLWEKETDFVPNFNSWYVSDNNNKEARARTKEDHTLNEEVVDFMVKLAPKQIRTFVVHFEYNDHIYLF